MFENGCGVVIEPNIFKYLLFAVETFFNIFIFRAELFQGVNKVILELLHCHNEKRNLRRALKTLLNMQKPWSAPGMCL